MADKLDRGFVRPGVRCPACGSRESLPADLMTPDDGNRRCVDCATPFVSGGDPMRPMGAGSEVRARAARKFGANGRPTTRNEKMGITKMGAYMAELRRKGVDLRSVLYRRASYRPTAQVEVYVAESAASADRIMREQASQPDDAMHWRSASARYGSNPGRTVLTVERAISSDANAYDAWQVSATILGRKVSKKYIGYTKPKAVRLFREEYLASEGEPYHEANPPKKSIKQIMRSYYGPPSRRIVARWESRDGKVVVELFRSAFGTPLYGISGPGFGGHSTATTDEAAIAEMGNLVASGFDGRVKALLFRVF